MPFTPITIRLMWLKSLLSIAIVAAGVFLLCQWYEHTRGRESTELRPPDGDGSDAARTASKVAERVWATVHQEPRIELPVGELAELCSPAGAARGADL